MPILPSRYRESVSLDFAAAAIVATLFVGIPVAAYSDYRSLFGELAAPKLFVMCGLGMSATFGLFFGTGRRLMAMLPGAVAGLTGVALYLYAPALHAPIQAIFPRRWPFFVFALGVLPGLLLYWLFRRIRGESDAL